MHRNLVKRGLVLEPHNGPGAAIGRDSPPLTIFACTIPTAGAASSRFLQEPALTLSKGCAAMLRALFDFVVDARSDPLGAGIPTPPFAAAQCRLFAKNAKERRTTVLVREERRGLLPRLADDTSITLAKPVSGRLGLPVCLPAATRAPAHFWANRERAS